MLPARIANVAELENLLSTPTPGAIDTMTRLDGDLMLLGVGGKMGPSLARMARRASDAAGKKRRIIGVSRFSDPAKAAEIQQIGVEPISCDLLDRAQVALLPDAPNVILMTGRKFGTTGQEYLTWATNTLLPALACERYRACRIVAFSTGNVYGLTPVTLGGSVESDPLRPVGEYSIAAVGRERIYEYASRTHGISMSILRLNYACELRYGVLADIARSVWNDETIDLAMGNCNAIWQGDANAMTLQALEHTAAPPRVLNIAGPECLSVRRVAQRFAEIFNKSVMLGGAEAADALLSNAQEALGLFGNPTVPIASLIEWIADWVCSGGVDLGKPTHFAARDGAF